MAKSYSICLDIGGTKVLGAVFDGDGKLVHRLKKRTKTGGGADLREQIVGLVREMEREYGIRDSQLRAIAAGAPGVVDQRAGVVLFAPNLPIRDYDLRTPMEVEFGVPFYIGNDVNVGVLGEHRYGAARGYHDVVGFFVGTGMGGGLILDDRLYTGHGCKGAEYGHMILDPEGPLCNCGQRGCLEAFSSKKGMGAYILQQISRGRKSMMEDKFENGVFKSKALRKAYEAGDAVTREAVDRACHYLAVATGNMIDTISPDVVIYGGGVIEAMGEVFLEKVLAEVDRYCMTSIRPTVELKQAALGDDSILYGGLAMIEGG